MDDVIAVMPENLAGAVLKAELIEQLGRADRPGRPVDGADERHRVRGLG